MTDPVSPELKEGLKPCPFCGGDEHLSMQSVGSLTPDMLARPYRVICSNIEHDDVMGPVGYGRVDAVWAWNRRADTASGGRGEGSSSVSLPAHASPLRSAAATPAPHSAGKEPYDRLRQWLKRGSPTGGMAVPGRDDTPSIVSDIRTLLNDVERLDDVETGWAAALRRFEDAEAKVVAYEAPDDPPSSPSPNPVGDEVARMLAIVEGEKAHWLKEALKHRRPGGRRSDHAEADLERARIADRILAKFAALSTPPVGGGKGAYSTDIAAAGPSGCAASETPCQSEGEA